MMLNPRFCALSAPLALLLVVGCGDDDGTRDTTGADTSVADAGVDTGADVTGSFAFSGEYDTDFGTFYRFTETGVWTSYIGSPAVAVTRFDNSAQWLVGQNSADDAFNPNKWSRFDFAEVGGTRYVCQAVFAADTEAEALEAPASDSADPASAGCDIFAWTALSPGQGPLPLIGSWLDNFGQAHEVSAGQWAIDDTYVYEVTSFDNALGQVVALNGEGNGEATGRFSRFDWAEVEGDLFYCQIVFDAETEAAAALVEPADVSGLTTDGCNGFSWSELIAVAGE